MLKSLKTLLGSIPTRFDLLWDHLQGFPCWCCWC